MSLKVLLLLLRESFLSSTDSLLFNLLLNVKQVFPPSENYFEHLRAALLYCFWTSFRRFIYWPKLSIAIQCDWFFQLGVDLLDLVSISCIRNRFSQRFSVAWFFSVERQVLYPNAYRFPLILWLSTAISPGVSIILVFSTFLVD